MKLPAAISQLFTGSKTQAKSPPVVEEKISVIAAIDQAPFTVSEAAVQIPPELLVAKLNNYLETILAAISESGGTCLRHIGCAVIAEWPLPQDEQARRQLGEGIVRIIDRCRAIELTPVLRIRPIIGLAHGQVIHSTHYLAGREVRLEMGPTVNRANQLCSMCRGQKTEVLFFKGLPVSWPSDLTTETLGPTVIAGMVDKFELQTVRPLATSLGSSR